jgi:hypothetical protein
VKQAGIFELTEDHVKLLRRMCVGWRGCEFGAPEIDPKRPYGNSSVECDIHEILTGEKDYELTDELRELYGALHSDTATALQIVLNTGSFEIGTFRREPFSSGGWKRVTP